MKLLRLILTAFMFGEASVASAQMAVVDSANLGQALKQVKAWADQYQQMKVQIDVLNYQFKALTGDRGMSTLLPTLAPMMPQDWGRSMTELSSLANQIRQSQAVLTPQQVSNMSTQLQQFLANAQNISAANQAMAQMAFNDAASRQTRLQTLTSALATTKDPKAAYDLANRIAIEHAALTKDQNQLEAAANGGAAQDRAYRLMVNQMRIGSVGTSIPKFDTALP